MVIWVQMLCRNAQMGVIAPSAAILAQKLADNQANCRKT
jgi:hypothetical protein